MAEKKPVVSGWTVLIIGIVLVVLFVLYLVYKAIKTAMDAANAAAAVPGNVIKGIGDAVGQGTKNAGQNVAIVTTNCQAGTTKVVNSDGSITCKPNNESPIAQPKCAAGSQPFYSGTPDNAAPHWHCEPLPSGAYNSGPSVAGTQGSGQFYNQFTNTIQPQGTGGPVTISFDKPAEFLDWRLRLAGEHPGMLICDFKMADMFRCVYAHSGADTKVVWRNVTYTMGTWPTCPGTGDPATYGAGDNDYQLALASKTQGNKLVPWF